MLVLLVTPSSLPGIILLSGDNSANQSDPGTGVPFAHVGSICDTDPQLNSSGSAVHIRGKYLLTADHVNLRDQVTFDGITFYEVDDAFTAIKISTADIVLIKLKDDPGLPDVTLNTDSLQDSRPLTETVMVGYGVGRNADQESAGSPGTIWEWSSFLATVAKRWGVNSVVLAQRVDDPFIAGNSYQALLVRLDTTGGNDEAAAVDRDSGSALFQRIGGQWVLSGVATFVTLQNATPPSSTFNTFNGDLNAYARISSYADEINALLPDLSTYAGWVFDNALNETEDAPFDDPDFDGLVNLLEYAFGTNPREADAQKAPRITRVGGNVVLNWQQSSVAGNLVFRVERTDAIGGTAFSDAALTPVQTGGGGDVTYWQVSVAAPASGAYDFLRLEVESTE